MVFFPFPSPSPSVHRSLPLLLFLSLSLPLSLSAHHSCPHPLSTTDPVHLAKNEHQQFKSASTLFSPPHTHLPQAGHGAEALEARHDPCLP